MLNSWFEKIDSDQAARVQVKQGVYGGLAFLVMNLIGVAFIYFFSKSASTGEAVTAEDAMYAMLGIAIVIPVQLLLIYRIFIGKGWLASIVLIVWFLFEVVTKVANGTTNIGWIIFYVALTVMMINGFRGCWYLKKSHTTIEKTD